MRFDLCAQNVLALVFVVLKANGIGLVAAWPWWLVLLPWYGLAVAALALYALMMLAHGGVLAWDWRRRTSLIHPSPIFPRDHLDASLRNDAPEIWRYWKASTRMLVEALVLVAIARMWPIRRR